MLLSAATLFSTSLVQADRALLVGVGEHANPNYNLSGIDLDIEMMRGVVQLMGIDEQHTKVLLNKQATLSKVVQTIEQWLIKEAKPDEHVVIYFSGHGTQVPDKDQDEADGADEALVMYDTQIDQRFAEPKVTGALEDDVLHDLLIRIPSNHVYVFIDACHSGTSTKNLSVKPVRELSSDTFTQVQEKYLYYKGMPKAAGGSMTPSYAPEKQDTPFNYVALAASQDHEKSIATDQGSIFTQAIHHSIKAAIQNKEDKFTFHALRDQTENYIKTHIKDRYQQFHPQLDGNPQLATRPLGITLVTTDPGSMWQTVAQLADLAQQQGNIPMQARGGNQVTYNDWLRIQFDIPWDGYLNIVDIGEDDQPTILFPNQFQLDNKVSQGRFYLPAIDAGWRLRAQKLGRSLTVAFLSSSPINLHQSGDFSLNEKEGFGPFAQLSQLGIQQIKSPSDDVKKLPVKMYAGQLITEVVKPQTF